MKLNVPACLLFLLAPAAAAAQQHTGSPVAAPGAVVRVCDARFTVLTDRMLRMEWAAGGGFEDSATSRHGAGGPRGNEAFKKKALAILRGRLTGPPRQEEKGPVRLQDGALRAAAIEPSDERQAISMS